MVMILSQSNVEKIVDLIVSLNGPPACKQGGKTKKKTPSDVFVY